VTQAARIVDRNRVSLFGRVFKAFQYRDFRLMWIGACTSSVGTWMQTVAQSWLVYTISNDARFLGLDSFLGQIPIVLFSLLGGVIADRRSRRHILLTSQYIQMTCAFTLATLAFLGVVSTAHPKSVWYILCLSFTVGLAQSFGGPAYSALVPTLVPKDDLPNAIALNSIQFNLARVIGPTLGGLALASVGAGWCFSMNGVSFLAVITTLYMVSVRFVPSRTAEPILESMKQGIRFIRQRPAMEPLIVLAFLMTMFGFPLLVFLPVFAKEVFKQGASTFTLLMVCSGAGAVCGALMVAWLGRQKRQGRNMLISLCLLGVLMIGFALSPFLPVACLMIFLAGAALMSVFSMVSSLVQTITDDAMRGRVMSVYNLAFRGGGPFGGLIVGALIPILTAPVAIAFAGAGMVLLGLYFLLIQRRVAAL
jgi:predicted MFS family arabinose efflux permease